ncbi:MAG: hypothetical protein ACKESB_02190 [Candidatus Hodgkinia cicadicola]
MKSKRGSEKRSKAAEGVGRRTEAGERRALTGAQVRWEEWWMRST